MGTDGLSFGSVNNNVEKVKNSAGHHRRFVGPGSEVRVAPLGDRCHGADPCGTTGGGGVVECLVKVHLGHILIFIVAPGRGTSLIQALTPIYMYASHPITGARNNLNTVS